MQLTALCKKAGRGLDAFRLNVPIMRTFIIIVLVIFLLSVSGYSQDLTLSLNNSTLASVFNEIQKQTPYRFVYTDEQLEGTKKISLFVQGGSLETVLRHCFKDQPLSYAIQEKFIIVRKKQAQLPNNFVQPSLMSVNGKVANEQGQSLEGVTLSVNRTPVALTNEFGLFEIKEIDPFVTLFITSVGYESLEVPLKGRTSITITLKVSASLLDETVVKGYYNTTRRLNSGSVSKISSDEIRKQPVTDPMLALQGRVAGAFITTTSGLPGSNVSVRIRGQNSIAAGNDPLFIIDGVPFSSTSLNSSDILNGANGKISPFSMINPFDIESIEVLKDADATAIYGSRGANGVILITTKRGKPGKTGFDMNVHKGISEIPRFPEFLSTQEYLEIRREAFRNDGVIPNVANAPDLLLWDSSNYTNWQKYVMGATASNTDIQTSVFGGSLQTRFLLGANYHFENSIYNANNKYHRGGVHFNLQHSTENNKFSAELTFNYSKDNNRLNISNVLGASSLPPNFPLYSVDGSLNWNGGNNPVAALLQRSNSETSNLLSNANIRYSLIPHLQIRAILGYGSMIMDQVLTAPLTSQNPSNNPYNYTTFGHNANNSYIIEPQIEYSNHILDGEIKAIMGSTWQKSERDGLNIQAINYSNEALLESLAAAGNIASKVNSFADYKYASIFALVNYNRRQKYLLNLSFRRDGSSRFGPGKEFGDFGAVSGGWLFMKEDFLQNLISILSFGKVRASYGITGNDKITDYQFLSTYQASGVYQNNTSLRPARIANPYYSWETNKKTELGLELGFNKDKILLTINWYHNKSGNQLVDFPLASQSGFSSYQANLPAIVINQGLEVEIDAEIFRSEKFKWSSNFNLTISKNRLKKFPELHATSYANTFVLGNDLSIVKGYDFTGVDPQTGIAQFMDINKDGRITNLPDYTVIGKTSPDYYGGLNSSLSYKSISADLFFQFVQQKGYNYPLYGGSLINSLKAVENRWQRPGDVTDVPKVSATPGTPGFVGNTNLSQSDYVFAEASFIRFKTLQVSYTVNPNQLLQLKISQCRIFLKGQNLLTITKYKGYDPETQRGGIPPLRTIVIGVQLSL